MELETLIKLVAMVAAAGLIGFARDIFGALSQIFGFSLHEAVIKGDVGKVEKLLESGANIDALDRNGRTPLRHALDHAHFAVVGLLLQYGADVNQPSEDGLKPSARLTFEALEELINDGEYDASRIERGNTILHLAATLGYQLTFDKYMDAGNIDATNNLGVTPLMLAATSGHYALAEHIVRQGANVNIKNKDGSTALMAASANPDLVRALIEHGSEVNVREAVDRWTAYVYAKEQGHTESMELLLAAGATDESANDIGEIGESTIDTIASGTDQLRVLTETGKTGTVFGTFAMIWFGGLVLLIILGVLNAIVAAVFDVEYLPARFMGSGPEIAMLVGIGPLIVGGAIGGLIWIWIGRGDGEGN